MEAQDFLGLIETAESTGDYSLVQHWITGRDLNQPVTDSGQTPLEVACALGAEDVVRLLAHAGADLDRPGAGESKDAPLHLAAAAGWEEVVQVLVDHGASTLTRNQDGVTRLGQTVSVHSCGGGTPLIVACAHGHVDAAKLLLLAEEPGAVRRAAVSATDNNGMTAFDHVTDRLALLVAGPPAVAAALQTELVRLRELLFRAATESPSAVLPLLPSREEVADRQRRNERLLRARVQARRAAAAAAEAARAASTVAALYHPADEPLWHGQLALRDLHPALRAELARVRWPCILVAAPDALDDASTRGPAPGAVNAEAAPAAADPDASALNLPVSSIPSHALSSAVLAATEEKAPGVFVVPLLAPEAAGRVDAAVRHYVHAAASTADPATRAAVAALLDEDLPPAADPPAASSAEVPEGATERGDQGVVKAAARLPLQVRHDGNVGNLGMCGFQPLIDVLVRVALLPIAPAVDASRALPVPAAVSAAALAVGGNGDPIRGHHAFYKRDDPRTPERRGAFVVHRDKSAYTLNICLAQSSDLKGSTVSFFDPARSSAAPTEAPLAGSCAAAPLPSLLDARDEGDTSAAVLHAAAADGRLAAVDAPENEVLQYEHRAGVAVVHSGEKWHRTNPTTTGTRSGVIIWATPVARPSSSPEPPGGPMATTTS